ncbi:PIG-L family deacetylase [Kitasatospora sp. NPDC056327]|uniref:PIG-L family deacetylase n=1 Tax=Kitasatospora sp. NPDC056327 TaxID=3345785 RepID=UPI0035DEE94E
MRRVSVSAAAFAVAVPQLLWVPTAQAEAAQAEAAEASVVQIVAHQDDDLLFMNPDVATSIRAGHKVTTVYVTAGEGAPRTGTPDPDRATADYARARQDGIRAAYARMAGVSGCDNSCWSTDFYQPVPGGPSVQRFTLGARPSVRVVFLGLPDYADTRHLGGNALHRLWNGRDAPSPVEVPTLDPDPSDAVPAQTYTGARLVDTLRGVLAEADATLVRVQDPAPDPLLYGLVAGEHDHPDHTSAAWFADEAVAAHTAGTPRLVAVEHYRDYNIQSSPHNLSHAQTTDKKSVFEAYAAHDEMIPRDPGGGIGGPYPGWTSRQYLRSQRSAQAVTADGSKALHAFAVLGGSLHEWAENGAKQWQAPTPHGRPTGPLAAGVTVARNADGRLEVFGQRADTGEIVSRSQTLQGTWTWNSLGSPNTISGPDAKLTNDALQVSTPTVASNGDGRLQLFVRNRAGGISTTWQTSPNGSWSGWEPLDQTGIQSAPAAVTTHDGRIEVFAVTVQDARSRVLHWYQPAPNTPLRTDPAFPHVSPASGISVGTDADGRLELFYRQIASTSPVTDPGAGSYTMNLYQSAPGGPWAGASGAVGGGPDEGGSGEAAVATPGTALQQRMTAAVRNRDGGVSFSKQGTTGAFGGWTDTGARPIVGVPAAAVDRDGCTDLVVIGTDGRLHHNRQKPDGNFGTWTPLPTP